MSCRSSSPDGLIHQVHELQDLSPTGLGVAGSKSEYNRKSVRRVLCCFRFLKLLPQQQFYLEVEYRSIRSPQLLQIVPAVQTSTVAYCSYGPDVLLLCLEL